MQLFFWLWMTVLGHAIVNTKGRLPAWRIVVNAMIPAAKFMDVFTDARVATLWWRQYQSNSCLWNGEQRCEICLRQFILITVATLLAYVNALLLKVVIRFTRMRPHHYTLSASLILGLVCEAVSLVANGLQVVAAEQNSKEVPVSSSTLLFIGLSAALTVVMFAISAVALYRAWVYPETWHTRVAPERERDESLQVDGEDVAPI
jgi:hypothetical protein